MIKKQVLAEVDLSDKDLAPVEDVLIGVGLDCNDYEEKSLPKMLNMVRTG